MYSSLNTLSECTNFYISKTLLFCLFTKLSKSLQCILKYVFIRIKPSPSLDFITRFFPSIFKRTAKIKKSSFSWFVVPPFAPLGRYSGRKACIQIYFFSIVAFIEWRECFFERSVNISKIFLSEFEKKVFVLVFGQVLWKQITLPSLIVTIMLGKCGAWNSLSKVCDFAWRNRHSLKFFIHFFRNRILFSYIKADDSKQTTFSLRVTFSKQLLWLC